MNKTIKKVSERFIKEAMATLIRNVADHDWGFFSEKETRMHLQTKDKKSISGHGKIKFWLEEQGKRTFLLAEGKPSKSDIKEIKKAVEKDRGIIEGEWTFMMLQNDYVKLDFSKYQIGINPLVQILAYPETPHKFVREWNLKDHTGETNWQGIEPKDFYLDKAEISMKIKRQGGRELEYELLDILWKD